MSATQDGTKSYRRTWRGAVDRAVRTHTTWLDRCWEATSRYHRNREGECEGCGGEPEHTHHIVPPAAGGTSAQENLMVLCGECHRGAHDLISGVVGFDEVLP
ncbi:HNH endonuclease [Salinigranum halophilum]|uniref:HNH endonuclease n=1 Tax=Salinigranum halophilum TaxID=2565931 RepID=UPI0010A85428|nr:HNH endonuclease [Salinigranum halophilum]